VAYRKENQSTERNNPPFSKKKICGKARHIKRIDEKGGNGGELEAIGHEQPRRGKASQLEKETKTPHVLGRVDGRCKGERRDLTGRKENPLAIYL